MAQKLPIEATWGNRDLKRGRREADSEIKSFVQGARTYLAAAGVAIGGTEIIRAIRNTYRTLSEEQQINLGLQHSLIQAGADLNREWSGIERTLGKLVAANRQFSGEDFRRAYDIMIQQTRDRTTALNDMQLAADLATARDMSLAQAADRVARARLGELEALGDLFPVLRQYTRSGEIAAGTTEAMAKAMQVLQERVGGRSGQAQDSLLVQSVGLANVWEELKEAWIASTVPAENMSVILGEIADNLQRIQEEQEAGGGERSPFWEFLSSNLVPPNPAQFVENLNKRAEAIRGLREEIAAMDQYRTWFPPHETTGGFGPGTEPAGPAGPFQLSTKEYIDALNKMDFRPVTALAESSRDAADAMRDVYQYTEDIRNIGVENLSTWAQDYRALGADLQSTLESALWGASERGWDGFIEVAKRKLQGELINWLAASLLNAIGGQGFGVFSTIGKAIGLGGGNQSTGITHGTGPSGAARMQSMNWRMQRGYG